MKVFQLNGKKILVTGASSGIGRAIAIACSNFGADLVLIGRDKARLKETEQLCDGKGHIIIQHDLSDLESLKCLIEKLPNLDGIVFSAGIIKRLPIKFIRPQSLQEVFEVNVFSIAEISRLLIKSNKLNYGGSLVVISSVGSDHASLGNISYMASKGAVNSFVKGLAYELAKSQIRVNAVLPGMIKTNLTKGISEADLELEISRYPLKRFGNPEDVAYATIYLLSEASNWVTGTKLIIDGGLTLR